MPEKLEIFFYDLNKEVQREVLNFLDIDTPEDGNLDVIPLFELSKEGGKNGKN